MKEKKHQKQPMLKNEHYLIRQDNTIYTFSIKLSFSSIGQDKSKLQKQINKLLIWIETAAWQNQKRSQNKQTYYLTF